MCRSVFQVSGRPIIQLHEYADAGSGDGEPVDKQGTIEQSKANNKNRVLLRKQKGLGISDGDAVRVGIALT